MFVIPEPAGALPDETFIVTPAGILGPGANVVPVAA
jgi:hypothetical protein